MLRVKREKHARLTAATLLRTTLVATAITVALEFRATIPDARICILNCLDGFSRAILIVWALKLPVLKITRKLFARAQLLLNPIILGLELVQAKLKLLALDFLQTQQLANFFEAVVAVRLLVDRAAFGTLNRSIGAV